MFYVEFDALGMSAGIDLDQSITKLLLDYPQFRFDFDLTQTLAKRAIGIQYRENDLAFLSRLLVQEGFDFRIKHPQQDDREENHDAGAATQARHQLVIFDSWDPQQLLVPAAKLSSSLALYDGSSERRLLDNAGAQIRRAHDVAAKAVTRCAADPRN